MNAGHELNKLRPRVALICQNPDHPADKPREYLGYDSKLNVCCRPCRNRVAYLTRTGKLP
jgi:hypothetical protein